MATVSQIAIRSLCVGSRNSIQALLLFTLRINARVFNSRLEYQEGGGGQDSSVGVHS
jgi:hypothetical protein